MTATALWFGPDDRPLFGWWHVPDGGRARGAVVLCPPFAMEAASAGPAFRRLAGALEHEGFLVLRFDYEGTGDSAGAAGDPGRVDAWLGSVQVAVDAVRACGVERVALVGMRMGATLAAVGAARGTEVDAIVLWDPCASGRSFLRHQRLMRELIGIGRIAPDGSTEAPGLVFGPDTVAELSALAIAETSGALAPDVLVLTRADQQPDRALVSRLSMRHVRWGQVFGQADLIDVAPIFARVPEADLATIVSWLSTTWDAQETEVTDPSAAGAVARAVVARDRDGGAIWERCVSLGPNGLFGIVTEAEAPAQAPAQVPAEAPAQVPAEAPAQVPAEATTVLLLPAGVIDHTGPARLWVELGRAWCGTGLRVVRLDTGGVGDSPPRGAQSYWFVSAPETMEDVADAIGHLAPTGGEGLVLMGMCSGGYQAVEAALRFPLLGIYLVNPSFSPRREAVDHDPLEARRQVPPSTRGWARALPAHDQLSAVVDRLPSCVWWVLNRVAVSNAPSSTLRRIAGQGTEVVLVCNRPDAWLATRGARRALRRFARSGRMRLVVLDDIDHTLLCRDGREQVVQLLTDHVRHRHVRRSGDAPAPIMSG